MTTHRCECGHTFTSATAHHAHAVGCRLAGMPQPAVARALEGAECDRCRRHTHPEVVKLASDSREPVRALLCGVCADELWAGMTGVRG